MHNWSSHFPALNQKPNGQRLAFLDSAASAQKPHVVIDALTQTLSGPYANIHRGLYHNSAVTTAAFEEARETLATFFNTPTSGLIFTRNATEGFNLIAQTWGKQHLKKSSVVVLSALEHHANIVPWQLLQTAIDFTIRIIPLGENGTLNLTNLAEILQGATLLSLTQKSNVTGYAPPLETIIPLAKKHGATVVIDGSQGAVHAPQNLHQLGADFYVCTLHKLYGPTGLGLLAAKPELLNTLPPYQGGGDMIENVSWSGTTFANSPARFEAGTPAIAEVIAAAEAIKFIQTIGWPTIQEHENAMAKLLTQELNKLPFITQYSPANTGIAAFNVQGAHPSDVATLLSEQGVAVRSGHHCAMPLMNDLPIAPEHHQTCLRASIALYTVEEDIHQLTQALHKAHQLLCR
ncbi:MAG: aminotransferase class V-fold PLP-dependent enzyme [Proteobacteria bacterium]|nr:aminotransferase class V-fold PLP-dependent enzyme [Pseudomonadota bacterium]NBX86169.1 aminotransferase class V-fold PLP-dependent enzyme [Pseudomonadota bacterium]